MALKFGAIVTYHGQLYFYQPNGTAGFLYVHEEDLGQTKRAKHLIAKKIARVVHPDSDRYREFILEETMRKARYKVLREEEIRKERINLEDGWRRDELIALSMLDNKNNQN